MHKERFIPNLTIFTIVVLTGIVGLQIYWLSASYKQQQSRFKADVENALSSANIKTTIRKAVTDQHNSPFSVEINQKDIDALQKEIAGDREKSPGSLSLYLMNSNVRITDTQKVLQLLKKMIDSNTLFKLNQSVTTRVRFEITDSDMLDYRNALKQELAARDINIPFELVITDSLSRFYTAADTQKFLDAPFKSAINELPGGGGAGLQAAFPGVNLYLLKKMLLVLSVTTLLILIGAVSFSYLLIQFFRQKKIADLRIDFMNNITHELKTPISSVGVALELVLDEQRSITPEKRRSYLVIAQGELLRLNLLIENALKIFSLEHSDIAIEREKIAVLPWLRGILNSMTPLLEQRATEVNLSVIPEDLEITADKIHITNVIQNILENALKYNDKKKPVVRIEVQHREESTCLKVSDNGAGIPARYLDKVFDKFFRVPQGDRHDVKGYGLGLSYVKGIIEKHEGSVQVKSVLREGSEFIISLPF